MFLARLSMIDWFCFHLIIKKNHMLFYFLAGSRETQQISQSAWSAVLSFILLFYDALDLNNQKILWLPSIFQFESKLGF